MCSSAPQQLANGTYRIVDILQIMLNTISSKYTNQLDRLIRQMNRIDGMCQGADQQSANYIYRCAEMIDIITDIMIDKKTIDAYWSKHLSEKIALLDEKKDLVYKIDELNNESKNVGAAELKVL